MAKDFEFDLHDLDSQLASFASRGITEFAVHDRKISSEKGALCNFLKKAAEYIPDVYITIPVSAGLIDNEVLALAQKLFCSLDIFLTASSFDKKLFTKKAAILNNGGLVFGFLMDFAISQGDSIKSFRDRIDSALPLYPNHIDFSQLYSDSKEEKNTATFSSQDINYARGVAFAVCIFYSAGRAVPWFNSVLKPLRIAPSRFFSDFAEWQACNNCGLESRGKTEGLPHAEIEKMQLLFLEEKYSEKKLEHLLPLVRDLVKINGAFSRLEGEGEETVLCLNFNPDDLLSPASLDLISFSDNVCMEECRVRVYDHDGEPDYRIL